MAPIQTSHIRFSVSVKTSSGRWRELEKLRFFSLPLSLSLSLSLFSHTTVDLKKNSDAGDFTWIKCHSTDGIPQHLAQLFSVFLIH